MLEEKLKKFSDEIKENREEVLEPKYELIEDEKVKMTRIRSLRDFCNVKKGDIGGIVEDGAELSQEGNCWIDENSRIGRGTKIEGDVYIQSSTIFSSYIHARGMIEASSIHQTTIGSPFREEYIIIDIKSANFSGCNVGGYRIEALNSNFTKTIITGDNCFVDCDAQGMVIGLNNSRIKLNNAELRDAFVGCQSDVIVFKNWWSSTRYFTWTRYNNLWKVGCFFGTGAELIKKAYKDSNVSGREYERIVNMVEESRKDYCDNIHEYKNGRTDKLCIEEACEGSGWNCGNIRDCGDECICGDACDDACDCECAG